VSFSQNLIPNGDFEEYSQLPTNVAQIYYCNSWSEPSGGDPDFYNSNSIGNVNLPNSFYAKVYPYSGNSIIGLYTGTLNYREYLTAELVSLLEIGEKYTLSFAITNGSPIKFSGYSSNNFGFFFSDHYIYNSSYDYVLLDAPIPAVALPVEPQIEITEEIWDTNWRVYSFEFIPDKAYQYIFIGNFRDDIHTTVTEHVVTFPHQNNGAYYFIDKIELTKVSKEVLLEMPNVFTPDQDGVNDLFVPVKAQNIASSSLTIINRWGEVVFESSDIQQGWDGMYKGNFLTDGVYFWKLDYEGTNKQTYHKTGTVSLVR
jgi:gliding motility-associated-like protein